LACAEPVFHPGLKGVLQGGREEMTSVTSPP